MIDVAGNSVAFQDDAAGGGLDVHLRFTVPAAGQYTAIVTSALPGESGSYSFTLAAAGVTAPAKPPAAASAAGAGTVSGTALDTAGQPLEGARVLIVPAVTTADVEVHTDGAGHYSVTDLPEVPYRARAWLHRNYGGVPVCLRLAMESPADYDTFSPGPGAVKNFRWQLTGPIPDQQLSLGNGWEWLNVYVWLP